MKENKILKINGTMLEKSQLEQHLEKIASSHNTTTKSQKDTYPVPHLIENFKTIEQVYELLNEHLKLGINIHPAGEWLLDNFYIIEETTKQIQKELPLNKYINFVGIANGEYQGFARIYVLASEIVAYTENKIEQENLEDYLKSYQTKKTLSMDEIWNIGIFLQIAIIENITDIALKIYSSQIQKYRVEQIAERLIEIKEKNEIKYKNNVKDIEKEMFQDMKYPFIEYMSYTLKRYGKKGYRYLKVLEEVVEKLGTTVSDVIKKEHFDIATQKVLMGNSITSIKKIQRINFLEIFEKIIKFDIFFQEKEFKKSKSIFSYIVFIFLSVGSYISIFPERLVINTNLLSNPKTILFILLIYISYITSFFNWFYCIKKSISLFIIIYFIPTYVIFFIYWYIYQKSIHNLATSMMFP